MDKKEEWSENVREFLLTTTGNKGSTIEMTPYKMSSLYVFNKKDNKITFLSHQKSYKCYIRW